MSNWWYATSVDVTNGSDLVRVNTGDAARYFERGSCWLKIAGHDAVETDGVITDGADTFIRLVKDWAGETDTERRAFAFRTVPDFQGVADKLALNIEASQDVVDNVISKIGTVLTSNDESIVIETAEGDVEVVPYGRLKADIEQQFNGFVDARQQQIDEATAKVDAFNLEQDVKRRATIYSDFAGNFHRLYNPTTKRNGETELEESWAVERTSAAWGFDPSGRLVEYAPDEPRLVIDPSTGEAEGILIEEQRTNVLLYSEDFSNSFYVKRNATVTADGSKFRVNCTADGEFGLQTNNVNFINDSRVIWIDIEKPLFADVVYLSGRISGQDLSSFLAARFDLNTLTVVSSENNTGFIRDLGGGIYRIGFAQVPTGSTYRGFTVGCDSVAGDFFNIHRGQIEVGSSASSYIKTTTTAVTRTADIVSRTLGAEWNPNEGTFVVEFSPEIWVTNQTIISLVDESSNHLSLRSVNGGVYWIGTTSGTAENYANIDGFAAPVDGILRVCATFDAVSGYNAVSINGVAAATDNNLSLASEIVGIGLGFRHGGPVTQRVSGTVSLLKYVPRSFTPEQVQAAATRGA